MKRSVSLAQGFVAGAARMGAVLAMVLTAACRTGHNYVDPTGPRYAGGDAADPVTDGGVSTLRVVTFNIEHGREIESATALLRDDPDLRHADVILLQEMDAPGVRRIARELALEYVYYPAIYHFREGNDFGNAILSRWPIVDDEKIVLPYVALATRIQRIAAAATLCVAGSAVRVYSIHLGTVAEILPGERRSQLRAVLADAADHARVIVGGDLNDADVGRVASAGGFDWPTRRGRRTATLGRWDHIFSRGLVPAAGESTGTVLDNRGSSDHRPVWTVLSLDRDRDTAAERCDARAEPRQAFAGSPAVHWRRTERREGPMPDDGLTQWLIRLRDGDGEALDRLLPIVYDELRSLARAQLRNENPGHTRGATALVHEAYIRLTRRNEIDPKDHSHFFAIAAQSMPRPHRPRPHPRRTETRIRPGRSVARARWRGADR